ncbi:hypothetical protein FHU13_000181 [Methylobacterium sp. R2-1]|nr:hypothetical protein [Methylobacterium sp. R2-1]MBB2959820.1 hypothetical protein [Methylobacterium sp. R2-1]
MTESPTVGELFKAKAVTDEQVNALVDAALAYQRDARAKRVTGSGSTSRSP